MRPTFPVLAAACAIALGLAACTDRADPARDPAAAIPESNAVPANARTPGPSQEATELPAEASGSGAAGPTPAPGAIAWAGFGPARFGASAEAVRMAWGKELTGAPDEADGCYYLYPEPRGQGGRFGIGFMIENQRFSRLDVDDPRVEAPGGGRVGMGAEQIRQRYAGIVEQPHKYVQGAKYLRRTDTASGGVLVFETDAAGKVTQWHVGVPPQVDYVEGCG